MNVIISQDNDQTIVRLIGRLDTTNAAQFQNDITPLMEAEHPNIVLDCTEMEYTSSQGLRMFLMLQKSVAAKSGAMVMTHMRPTIREVFDITGFSKIIHIE